MFAIGKKGRDTLRKREVNLTGEYLNVSSRVDYLTAKEIADKIAKLYAGCPNEVDAVYAVYNEFKNVIVQKLTVAKLLPIDPAVLDAEAVKDAAKVTRWRDAK